MKYEGRDTIIVPVLMARADVVMNGSRIPEEELFAASWNGVPVTVGHPESKDGFVSANAPRVLTDWAIGKIFNASVDGGKLKGEAWIDVDRANSIDAGLVEAILAGGRMEVSTGYFCEDIAESGVLNGREYETVNRGIKPDHLAFLPNEEGACSWDDGCGVRANNQRGFVMRATDALKAMAKALNINIKVNADEEKDDRGEAIAALIKNEGSPFGDDDKEALEKMSAGAFGKVCSDYGDKEDDEDETETNAEVEEDDKDEPDANEDDEGEEDEDEKPATKAKKGKVTTDKTKPATRAAASGLSDKDREALKVAHRRADEHRAAVIGKITANTSMKKAKLETMSLEVLEDIAGGIIGPAEDYSARFISTNAGEASEEVKAMAPQTTFEAIKARRAKKEAA